MTTATPPAPAPASASTTKAGRRPHTCLACSHTFAYKPRRGLCSPCYGKPAVREKFAGKVNCPGCGKVTGWNHINNGSQLCVVCRGLDRLAPSVREHFRQINDLARRVGTGPTDYPPGSPGRIAVMCARVDAGLPVIDPRDTPRSED